MMTTTATGYRFGCSFVVIPDSVVPRGLAAALRQKQFRIVADVMEVGIFAGAGDRVDFSTAGRKAK